MRPGGRPAIARLRASVRFRQARPLGRGHPGRRRPRPAGPRHRYRGRIGRVPGPAARYRAGRPGSREARRGRSPRRGKSGCGERSRGAGPELRYHDPCRAARPGTRGTTTLRPVRSTGNSGATNGSRRSASGTATGRGAATERRARLRRGTRATRPGTAASIRTRGVPRTPGSSGQTRRTGRDGPRRQRCRGRERRADRAEADRDRGAGTGVAGNGGAGRTGRGFDRPAQRRRIGGPAEPGRRRRSPCRCPRPRAGRAPGRGPAAASAPAVPRVGARPAGDHRRARRPTASRSQRLRRPAQQAGDPATQPNRRHRWSPAAVPRGRAPASRWPGPGSSRRAGRRTTPPARR